MCKVTQNSGAHWSRPAELSGEAVGDGPTAPADRRELPVLARLNQTHTHTHTCHCGRTVRTQLVKAVHIRLLFCGVCVYHPCSSNLLQLINAPYSIESICGFWCQVRFRNKYFDAHDSTGPINAILLPCQLLIPTFNSKLLWNFLEIPHCFGPYTEYNACYGNLYLRF